MSDFSVTERPKYLKDIVGNEDIKQQLTEALAKNVLPKSMLFCGASGQGKTTFVRCIGNELGISDEDFLEIDAALCCGVNEVRAVTEKLDYPSFTGGKRIIFFDEVHKMTKAGAEALLKVTEEPPPDVYFLAATTEPDKLLPTFRQRFVKYEVKPLSEEQLVQEVIKPIKVKYGFKLSKEIATEIANRSMGSARICLKLLYSIHHLEPEKQKLALDKATAEANSLYECYNFMMSDACRGWNGYTKLIPMLKSASSESENIRYGLLAMVTNSMVKPRFEKELMKATWLVEALQESTYPYGWSILCKNLYYFVNHS